MTDQNKNEVVITRLFDAPVATVWKYWSDPEYMKKWHGPKHFTAPVSQIDFKVGGKYLSCMEDEKGNKFWSTGTYKEIVPLKKIVCTDSFADDKGNIVSASQYGMEGFPLELEVSVTFEEVNGKTKMTLVHSGVENVDEKFLKDMNQGWNESFDKMAENLV